VLSDLLRREMGYRGLVFTDSLGMGGVLNHVRDWPEAQVLALAAGCDVLVMPTGIATDGSRSHLLGVERGIAAIRQAVRRGRLSAARIEASTRRVLAAKTWLGLPGSTASDPSALDSAEHRAVAQRIARSALTLVQDRRGLLPLTPGKRLGIVRLTNREGDGAFGRDSDAFVSYFRSVDTVQWSATLPSAKLGAALELAARVDVLLVAASLKVFVGDGSGDLSAEHRAALARLSAANPNLVFLSFGSPYALAAVRDLSTLVCAYDYSAPMQEAAARALFSSEPWTGKLPVRI
jgi:beta-N-acetylhexosaminidase